MPRTYDDTGHGGPEPRFIVSELDDGTFAGASATYPIPTNGRITDRQGRSAKISQKGEFLTGSCIDDVDVNFQYVIRTAETVETTSGTGAVSHPGASGAYAELSPGAGVGKAKLVSKASVRYRAGHEVYCELSVIHRAAEANLNQYSGFINDNDAWAVGYEGTDFGFLFREGGNDTFYVLSAGDTGAITIHDPLDGTGPSGFTINPQAINVFRLAFVWHGGLPLTVEVQVGQQWYPVATLDFSNSITETHLENPHLPVGCEVERTAGTGTNAKLLTGSWRGGAIASAVAEPSDDWTSHTVLDVSLVSSDRTNIVTFRNPSTWQGKINHIAYELGVIAFANGGNKDVAVYGTKGATLTGASAEQWIDESNYALKTIEDGTVSGGTRGPATILSSGGERRTDVLGTGIFIYPGEDLTIEVDPGGAISGSFSCSARLVHNA